MNAIEISNLKKTYDSGENALKGIDLKIPQGSFYGLLGPNGAGKTTTIGILTGLVNKTSGTTTVMNFDTVNNFRESRKLIGLSPQEINLDVFFSIREFHASQVSHLPTHFVCNVPHSRQTYSCLDFDIDVINFCLVKTFTEYCQQLKLILKY